MFVAFIGLSPIGAAATDEVHGKVVDCATEEPIAGCIVKSKGSFTSTDKKGGFSLTLRNPADSVTFSFIGYESLTLPVTADMQMVKLTPKTTVLKDVVIEAPDIYARGDTLVFNVARYANAKDNAIIDVIKRLPGIKVKDDGTIEYQGKPISKFYLDGNDFIGGQYGLATNNISYKDVASVEVLENHQPVKALEGIEFPEEAGINLKLKEDARSRWVGLAQAATGVQPLLYDGSLFTMRIASKIQNMFTLKADNTGWNPVNEIKEHNFDDMFSSDYTDSLWPDFISAGQISAPLSEKRTRDNLSWLANGITAWKSGDTSMRLKLNYMADRLDYNSGSVTDYFSNQIPDFRQNIAQRTQNHDLSAQFNSETNKRGYYLKDKLTISGVWDNSRSYITGSYDLQQRTKRSHVSAVNDLKLVRRNEKNLFTLASRNSFDRRPERLSVSGEENSLQLIGTTDFRSTTETRVGKLMRFWKYYLTAGIDLDFHHIDNRLTGFREFDNDGGHDAFLSNLYALPQVDYERGGWRLSLKLPLKWRHYSLAGEHDYLDMTPRLSAHRQLTAKSELSGSITYKLGAPQPYLNVNAAILSDYRNLTLYTNPDRYTQDLAASLSYRYWNPLRSFFANVSASYNYQQSSIMMDQLFIDDFIISSYADRPYHSGTWYLKGALSKGLGHSKMVVGLEADAMSASTSSMRDNAVIPFRQTSVGIKPYFKGSILKWLSANYEAEYQHSGLTIDSRRNNYHTLHQALFVTLIPSDQVQFTFEAEHFFTRFPEGNSANLALLDASAVWKANQKIRLSLTANNLLNKRSYEYVTYGTLSRTEHIFRLRPRSIVASIQYRF